MKLEATPVADSPLDKDAAPNRNPAKKVAAPALSAKERAKPEVEMIVAALEKAYATAGIALSIVSPNDGRVIVAGAGDLAASWRDLLANDSKLRARMKKMIAGTGWGVVIAAHLAIALPIIKNHDEKVSHLFKTKRVAERESID